MFVVGNISGVQVAHASHSFLKNTGSQRALEVCTYFTSNGWKEETYDCNGSVGACYALGSRVI